MPGPRETRSGANAPAPDATQRARWRGVVARCVFVTVVCGQIALVVRAYHDPHRFFGFQPFNESSTFRADIYRVTTRGRRISIQHGWSGYEWQTLVNDRGLGYPWTLSHADSGAEATLDFLQKALDWVADHTPNDRRTLYLEADVTYYWNTRGPRTRVLRSRHREEAMSEAAPARTSSP